MKYCFLGVGIMSWIIFCVLFVHRINTGEIMPAYYPSQMVGLLCIGIFLILNKLDNLNH